MLGSSICYLQLVSKYKTPSEFSVEYHKYDDTEGVTLSWS
jgi:hypothetical protein